MTTFQQAAADTEQLEDGLRRALDLWLEAEVPPNEWPLALRLWAVELVRARVNLED